METNLLYCVPTKSTMTKLDSKIGIKIRLIVNKSIVGLAPCRTFSVEQITLIFKYKFERLGVYAHTHTHTRS